MTFIYRPREIGYCVAKQEPQGSICKTVRYGLVIYIFNSRIIMVPV